MNTDEKHRSVILRSLRRPKNLAAASIGSVKANQRGSQILPSLSLAQNDTLPSSSLHRCASVPHLWLILFLSFCSQVSAQPAPADNGLTVTEWVILVCDPNVPQASAGALFQSTLPDFVAGRRTPALPQQVDVPSPIGLIRLGGGAVDERVDILLENKGGKFLAQWPKGQQRSSGVLWQNLEPKIDGVTLEPVTAGNWFNRLRQPAGPFWTRDGKGERFILYDLELNYALPLRLKAAPEGAFELVNSGAAPLRDVTIYQMKPDGWHSGTLAELIPVKKGPATKPASTTRPALTIATTAATTAPTTRPAIVLALDAAARKDELTALAPWTERLTATGLPATDFDVILSILRKFALDPHRVTVVYRLDPAELDRLLPMEVTPQPKKIVRVGLVIALNVDPALGDEVDRLITLLGDDDWSKREAAHKQLVKLGLAAKPKLEGALKNKDLEVVYRAEKLIQALTAPPAPQGNEGVQLNR
jgi:hypothetical protein